jgi:ABC-type uncharacterized transport system fused permease/ATPase subunit
MAVFDRTPAADRRPCRLSIRHQRLESGDLRRHGEARCRDRLLSHRGVFPLAIGSVLLGVAQVFARMGIQRRWRAWLTNAVISRWLANGRYYQLNLVGGDHQNPEYRIAEDLRIATDSPVDFVAGVASAFLSAATFIVVLWTIGGALTVTLGGSTVTIPGFLVIAAILYAAIAFGSIMTIGRSFVQVSEDKNQAEAEYRYALTRVRENGESIARCSAATARRTGCPAGACHRARIRATRWRGMTSSTVGVGRETGYASAASIRGPLFDTR